MRMLMRAQMDTAAGNKAINDGTLPRVIQSTIERLRPEAAYFTATEGMRTAFIVFDLHDPSDIPTVAEPFFMELGAKVEFTPVMNADEVRVGVEKMMSNR
jgi:hypothetical protein